MLILTVKLKQLTHEVHVDATSFTLVANCMQYTNQSIMCAPTPTCADREHVVHIRVQKYYWFQSYKENLPDQLIHIMVSSLLDIWHTRC